jgi:hypothetical protein
MNKYLSTVMLVVLLSGCSSTYYLVNTNYSSLYKGMTKEQFIVSWVQPTLKQVKGNLQGSSRQFTIGNDQWEVLIYSVYEFGSVRNGNPQVDHKEYIAFRNGRLEEWGLGTLPMSLQGNPNVIHVESGR